MADNRDNVQSDNPANFQADNPPNEIIPGTGTETTNTNQETENMEVHKHPHHITHKKKWPEYLLEFIMLFLAVFLGFVAENYREHIVEQEREKQYMATLVEDLNIDTADMSRLKQTLSYVISREDS